MKQKNKINREMTTKLVIIVYRIIIYETYLWTVLTQTENNENAITSESSKLSAYNVHYIYFFKHVPHKNELVLFICILNIHGIKMQIYRHFQIRCICVVRNMEKIILRKIKIDLRRIERRKTICVWKGNLCADEYCIAETDTRYMSFRHYCPVPINRIYNVLVIVASQSLQRICLIKHVMACNISIL